MRFRLTGTSPQNYRVHLDEVDISEALVRVELSLTAGGLPLVTLYADPASVYVDLAGIEGVTVEDRPLDTEGERL